MIQDFIEVLKVVFSKKNLIQAIFSDPQKKTFDQPLKTSVRPLLMKDKLFYQFSEQRGEKVLHRNVLEEECQKIILEELIRDFKQAVIYTSEKDYHILVNQKGTLKIIEQKPSQTLKTLSHNRKKNYLVSEGTPLPFLIELGLMNAQGNVFPHKRDKFYQINRFLEMVEDTLDQFQGCKSIHIVDYGCGKAYLTFALYHFLHEKKFDVHLTGLDKKKDVIAFCQSLALKCGYQNLHFSVGDITDHNAETPIDMVIALHACDTATDAALQKGILWQAKVILAAPCCQHELLNQISSNPLAALLSYGILKERFSALLTDAARSHLLQIHGYQTQTMEFIDSEHTPKNLLIRAIRGISEKKRQDAKEEYRALKEALGIHSALERLLQ